MKKVTFHRGSPKKRVVIKGHFLAVHKTLEELYYGAKFIAQVRYPINCFCSSINFVKVITATGNFVLNIVYDLDDAICQLDCSRIVL